MTEFLTSHWAWVLLGVIILFALFLGKLLLREERFPYEKRSSLVTQAELHFLATLREAVGDHWHIMAMVRLADLIRVRPKTPNYQSWQNRIQAKHIDFVLCDHKTLEARLAVELDDKTHQRPDRVERDRFVNEALETCDLPLLRVPVTADYDANQLRGAIAELIE